MELARGLAYANYVIGEVMKVAIFSLLDIVPSNTWATFLFMDLHNYGGVPFTDSESSNGEDKALTKYVAAHHKNILRRQQHQQHEDEDDEDKENNMDDNEVNIKKGGKRKARRTTRRKKKEINVRFEDDTAEGDVDNNHEIVDLEDDVAAANVKGVHDDAMEEDAEEDVDKKAEEETKDLLAQFRLR